MLRHSYQGEQPDLGGSLLCTASPSIRECCMTPKVYPGSRPSFSRTVLSPACVLQLHLFILSWVFGTQQSLGRYFLLAHCLSPIFIVSEATSYLSSPTQPQVTGPSAQNAAISDLADGRKRSTPSLMGKRNPGRLCWPGAHGGRARRGPCLWFLVQPAFPSAAGGCPWLV